MANRNTYTPQTWENLPDKETPISAERLGHIESGIKTAMDDRALKEIYNDSYMNLQEVQGQIPVVGNGSIVHGSECSVPTTNSYAGGENLQVLGASSHAEGSNNTINGGEFNHAEGSGNTANGCTASHLEGIGNTVNGNGHHAEGNNNTIGSGVYYSHIEGQSNQLTGGRSHLEGMNNKEENCASKFANHIEGGSNTNVSANYVHMEGVSNFNGDSSGKSGGNYSHIEGYNNATYGSYNHIEGRNNKENVSGTYSDNHTEGGNNTLYYNSDHNHTEGNYNECYNAQYGHFEGYNNKTFGMSGTQKGNYIHMEGASNKAGLVNEVPSGNYIHMEGYYNTVFGDYDHVEGAENTENKNGAYSYNHIEGHSNDISGAVRESHIEGYDNTVSTENGTCDYIHVEGQGNTLTGSNKAIHVGGFYNTAKNTQNSGYGGMVIGMYNIMSNGNQFVCGKYSEEDSSKAFIVGGGSYQEQKNIYTLDWQGNAVFSGNVQGIYNGEIVSLFGLQTQMGLNYNILSSGMQQMQAQITELTERIAALEGTKEEQEDVEGEVSDIDTE